MTWHNRSDEQPAPPSLVEVIVFALFSTAYLVWMVSVGLAR